jgi:hypothetical protein
VRDEPDRQHTQRYNTHPTFAFDEIQQLGYLVAADMQRDEER